MAPAAPLPDAAFATLNPGIRETVRRLRAAGFETCDSGDGQTHAHPCDRPYPFVACRVQAEQLVAEARRLAQVLRSWGLPLVPQELAWKDEVLVGICLQASYDPATDFAVLDLMGLRDAQLPPSP